MENSLIVLYILLFYMSNINHLYVATANCTSY